MHVVRFISRTIPLCVVMAIAASVDRLLKYSVYTGDRDAIRIIPGFFHIQYTLNTHAAFSIALPHLLYVGLYIIALLCVAALWFSSHGAQNIFLRIAGASILVGAISNIWDRIMYGGVIDMLAIPGIGACNLADMYITLGVLIWAFVLVRTPNDSIDAPVKAA